MSEGEIEDGAEIELQEILKERAKRPYDAMGDDWGRSYTGDEAYRREFVYKYDDKEE